METVLGVPALSLAWLLSTASRMRTVVTSRRVPLSASSCWALVFEGRP